MRRGWRVAAMALAGLGLVAGCGFDGSLREYLDAHFWLPFSKQAWSFEKKNVRRVAEPFAGMTAVEGDTALARLRAAYQEIRVRDDVPAPVTPDADKLHAALAAAREDVRLTRRDREEVDLIDAKIEMRLVEMDGGSNEQLTSAEGKLRAFLKAARTPEFLSEARGWLAHIYFVRGEQTAAGKIYLDELNRDGSNLGRETLLNSLRLTYGYDGGAKLVEHLDEYFDTAEHAAFAIQIVSNPHRDDSEDKLGGPSKGQVYARIQRLLEEHATLLNSNGGSKALAVLGMRTALRMGDPAGALKVAAMVSGDAAIRKEPDFLWMAASAHFLTHDFAGAEAPLIELFQSGRASENERSAAAYGLCGVYQKTGNMVEQIRFALWLRSAAHESPPGWSDMGSIADQTIYWAVSGWDLSLLLDMDASDEPLEAFLKQYPDMKDARLVRYALAVRRARENRYDAAAEMYESIHAWWRAPRMRQLAELYREANRTDLDPGPLRDARYRFAAALSANSTKVYFNDQLWGGLQRYALEAAPNGGLSGDEREAELALERKLKDDQEELWRAYLLLHDVVRGEGRTELGRRSAGLAVSCLRRINADRFGRGDEIRTADIELSAWLRQ